ncbi:HD domain-containing protein [Mitsuokella sp.]|uniref:HD domain-containing protein n=1 Tax=Mitsuokella sp. TaxID=2049034 RepID=UPI002A8368D3|nr:HD domain-containing protein [Mitsuokella sp.]MDY4475889.1 HD domain-containing protein [Mitsuokella sp.]
MEALQTQARSEAPATPAATVADVLAAMIEFDRGDARRIQHLLKVYAYASLIGKQEGLPEDTQRLLEMAAILHDIGIHAAEATYGSTAGVYQEKEGPAPARQLLQKLGIAPDVTERICFLIGHHHTYQDVDGPDYQILLEADFLVNAYEDQLSQKGILAFREKVFRTPSGIRLLNTIYGLTAEEGEGRA